MKRTSTAVWKGTAKDGRGYLTTQSTTLDNTKYTWKSRFEGDPETNPEELIAAAHAGCFSMAFSFALNNEGYTADNIETTATVTLDNGTITHSHLIVNAKVPGINQETFEKCAKGAKESCPVSKVLNLDISMDAKLV
ncbi:MAG: OsmC family protein [Bacteroidales bacterium]|nr:OsmC family protein [Bacteroidales bacterium]